MRPGHRADEIIGAAHVSHPVAQRFVHGILERPAAGLDHAHFGAQQLHAKDVERLALDIFRAHENLALHAEARRHGGGRHAMLAGAGLSDNAPLAHVPGQENLPHGVVDLMRAGVAQILALEIDRRPAQAAGQSVGEIERRFPADIFF